MTNRPPQSNYYSIKREVASTIYTIYLNGIVDAIEYHELLDVFNNASENDIIKMHINSNGGSMQAGMQILNAMEQTAATIITILAGDGASMAGIIFLAGHNLTVLDNSMLMLHTFSFIMSGKSPDHENYNKAGKEIYHKMIDKYASRVLSKKEIGDMKKGVDIYIGSGDLIKRLQKWQKKLTTKLEEERNNESDMG